MRMTYSRNLCLLSFALVCGQLSAGNIEPVYADEGMVVAGHPEAAEIGRDVLRNGGTAMDAVVATALALGVAEPYGSGLGGKCALLYYEAATEKVWFIDGMDAAGAEFDPEKLAALSSSERAEGGAGIGVPGLLAALELGHGKWGKLPWSDVVLPSARLAREGFAVVPGMLVFFERRVERVQSHPETARIYLPGGVLPPAGSRLPSPDLAWTLERIAKKGRAGFYEGPVARRMVKEVRRQGGHLTRADFRDYEARLSPPISLQIGETLLYAGGPPTTGGATSLLSLKALEDVFMLNREVGFHSTDNLDRWARILRHVYPKIQASVADAPESLADWQKMVQPEALQDLRSAAGVALLEAVTAPGAIGEPADFYPRSDDGWTTHFVVADKYGNLASVTQSLSHHFGSGVTPPGTGVVMNNSLKNFSFSDPEAVNYGAPGKRPRSTIAPIIGLRGGKAAFALGLPGGGRIPTTTLAVLCDHLLFGSDLGTAISDPRVHLLRSWSEAPDSNILQLESGLPQPVEKRLRELGWEVERVTDTEFFGGMTAVEREPEGGWIGWADFRRTNFASGY
jgi:gamma-glutamyltranspeptidase/glutathione hydrolase